MTKTTTRVSPGISANFPRLSPIALALVALAVQAQESTASSATSIPGGSLAPVFITANPLGDTELIAPATAIYG
ncbi:hypothetical protein, partial [uncultured Paraburkholderia sp.]